MVHPAICVIEHLALSIPCPWRKLHIFAESDIPLPGCSLFSEVEALKNSDHYWRYVAFKLRKLEQMWAQDRTNVTEKLEAK